MSALTAVLCAGFNIGALAIAIGFGIFALCAAFAARADKTFSALDAGCTAASLGVLGTFSGVCIDMKAVDALQEFACALRASAALPASDGGGAGTAMKSAVFNVIELAGVFIDVHTFGASLDCASCLYAISVCPTVYCQAARRAMCAAVLHIIGFAGIVIRMKARLARADVAFATLASAICPTGDFNGAVGIMAAAVIDIIRNTFVLKRMKPGGAGFGDACLIYTCTRFPALHLIGTFGTMFATMIFAVFLTDHVIMMFIWLAVRRATAAVSACFGIFARDKVFAVCVCAAELVRCHGIDASAVAAHIAFGFTCGIFTVVVTSNYGYAR